MGKVAAMGNNKQLFGVIKETGTKNPTIIETNSEKHGTIIHSQSIRLD